VSAIKDGDGRPINVNDMLIISRVSEDLLRGLPVEDQKSIRDQVGHSVSVQGFDDHGNVEVEFKDSADMIHTIWIEPRCLRRP